MQKHHPVDEMRHRLGIVAPGFVGRPAMSAKDAAARSVRAWRVSPGTQPLRVRHRPFSTCPRQAGSLEILKPELVALAYMVGEGRVYAEVRHVGGR